MGGDDILVLYLRSFLRLPSGLYLSGSLPRLTWAKSAPILTVWDLVKFAIFTPLYDNAIYTIVLI